MASPSPERHGAAAPFEPGHAVGNRFEVQRAVSEDALGSVLEAKDRKTGRRIALRILAPGLVPTDDAKETLKREVRSAAALRHERVVATYGLGTDRGARFVATEWVGGESLTSVIRRNLEASHPMSLRGVLNVLSHVVAALEAAREAGGCHGALRPSVVHVTASGRVKVGGFGLDRTLVALAGPAALGPDEQPFLAPEVKAGGEPDPRSDVFGLGGLLYAMLTGRSAAEAFKRPSDVHPEADARLDALLLQCLSADPESRFTTAGEARAALLERAAGGLDPTHDDDDFGVTVDLDEAVGSIPPPAPAPTKTAPPPRPRSQPPTSPVPDEAPAVGSRVALGQSFRPDAPSSPAAGAEFELGDLLARVTENDAPRWMVQKDRLDHGPFSGRELVQLILKGEVLARHDLQNMDTGERQPVGDSPDFAEFTEQYRRKKAKEDEAAALAASTRRERASTRVKTGVLLGLGLLLAASAAAFALTMTGGEDDAPIAIEDDEDLYAAGEIEINGEGMILEAPPPRRRSGSARPRRSGGPLSYEEAMNQVVQMGDVSQGGGGQHRLGADQVASVMNRNIGRFRRCVGQARSRSVRPGEVRIDLAIAGTGQVLGASVQGGDAAFQQCVAQSARGVRFPSFSAPRMGARYRFNAN